jgi:hypothetical protein
VPDVAAALLTPVAFNPDGVATRRTTVGSVGPDVGVAVPAVIAGGPDVAFSCGGDDFDGSRGRRADADYELGVGSPDGKKEGACCGEELLLHGWFS